MLVQTYNAIMDPEVNPLRRLPRIVRFQIMSYLAMMWSIVFCVWIGAMSLIGPSLAVHAILLAGVYFTADVFRRASQPLRVDHRAKYRDPEDGCARYDDIWGA